MQIPERSQTIRLKGRTYVNNGMHHRLLEITHAHFEQRGMLDAQPFAMRSLFDAHVRARAGQYLFREDSMRSAATDAKRLSVIMLPGTGSKRHAAEAAIPFFETFAGVSVRLTDTPSKEQNDYALRTFDNMLQALRLGMLRGALDGGQCGEQLGWLAQVPAQAESILDDVYDLEWFVRIHALRGKILLAGEGVGYVLAKEARRLMRGIAPCKAIQAARARAELLSGEYTLLVAFALSALDLEWAATLLSQCGAAGLHTVAITMHAFAKNLGPQADACWTIPTVPPVSVPILGILPMQVFAHNTALSKGIGQRPVTH